ncbi:MAG: outer membrane beta-barrel protein [Acidobacteriota bacterium]|nr:outer membrane beta-barrel protein [Acidobacteriota bacterium]
MKKLVFLFVLVSLVAAPVLTAEQAIVLKVKVQVANVRAEPDMNSTVVKKIPADTLLEARQRIGDWYEITVTDASGAAISGYIHQQVVDVVAGAPREPEPVREEPRRPVREPVREEPRQPVERRMAPVSYRSDYGMGGFKAIGGLAMASLRYPTEETAEFDKYKKSKMGLAGGIGFDSGGQFGFGMNVLYLQKGVKYSGEEDGVKFSFPISIDMISLPVMAKIRFMPGSTPYALAGGEVAYVLSAKSKYTITDLESGEKETDTEDFKDDINSIDYGIVFGLGYEMNTGSFPIFIEARYHLGLANLTKDNPDEGIIAAENWTKTSTILIVGGIRF